MSQILRTSVLSIGENKGCPRIWQENKILEIAGFHIGEPIRITYTRHCIRIIPDVQGDHKVSKKRNVPVIDINNSRVGEVFDLCRKVQVIVKFGEIIIRRTYTDNRIAERLNDNSCAGVFVGGGLLDQAAKQAGFIPKWAIEINEKYADLWQANHKGTMHNCSISDIDYDLLEPVALLVAGIPCEPFSIARQNQHDQAFHDNENLSMFILFVIKKINPRTIILEEVPQYLSSQIGKATIKTLKEMGYNVECKIVKGTDFGELMVRKRVAIVATTPPQVPKFPVENPIPRKMSEILLSPDDPRCEWFTLEEKQWLKNHWEQQKAKGNNFHSQIITMDSDYVSAVTRRYFAQQGSNPIVAHPTKPNTFRWLTPIEVKRLMGLPDDYDLGDTKTLAGEVMGQGVLVKVFQKVIEENKK
jgi:DNA (cytosine-5)-methyltransferase 1